MKPDAVLVDDDILVRFAWIERFKSAEKSVEVFDSFSSLQEKLSTLSKETPIFVDASLGDNERGEDVTKALAAQGFTKLYLATGYQASEFAHVDWISGVVGKEPPDWLFQ